MVDFFRIAGRLLPRATLRQWPPPASSPFFTTKKYFQAIPPKACNNIASTYAHQRKNVFSFGQVHRDDLTHAPFGFQSLARAILACFGAGSAAFGIRSALNGENCVHASERNSVGGWSSSKHAMAVSEARGLLRSACTGGAVGSLQPGTADDSPRPTRLPFAPYPFSSRAATAVDMPLTRLPYRQGAWVSHDSPPDSRCRPTCFEQLQWELSPEQQEAYSTAGDVGGDSGRGRSGRDGDAGSSMRLPAGSLQLSDVATCGRIGSVRRGSSGLSEWDLSMTTTTTTCVSHQSSRPPPPPAAVAVGVAVAGGEHNQDSLQSLDTFSDSYGLADESAWWYGILPAVAPGATSAKQCGGSEQGASSGGGVEIEVVGGSECVGGAGEAELEADSYRVEGLRNQGPDRAGHLRSATWQQQGRSGVGSAEAEMKIMLQVAEGPNPPNQFGKSVEEQTPEWLSSSFRWDEATGGAMTLTLAAASAAANATERATILTLGEALCHSQTRARKAEEGEGEREQMRERLRREMALNFAYRQYITVLQAENAVLRQQSVDGRGSNENDVELMLNMTAVAFSLGLGLAGMAVYLGWSLGLIVMPVQGLG